MPRPPRSVATATPVAVILSLTAALVTNTPAHAADPPAQVEPRTGTETPALVSGLNEAPVSGDPVAVARHHLRQGRYGITNVNTDLVPLDVVRDGQDETVRFEQRYQGIRVFGANYLVQMTKEGNAHRVTGAGGRFLTELSVSTTPKFPERLALDVARSRTAARTGGEKEALTAVSGGLVVVPTGEGLLAWRVTVTGTDARRQLPLLTDVYVNAGNGAPLFASDRIRTAVESSAEGHVATTGTTVRGATVPINAYQRADGKYELRDRTRWNGTVGEVVTYDAQKRDVSRFQGSLPADTPIVASDTPTFTGTTTEIGAVDAHWGANQVYEYYRRLGRDGLDGKGGSMLSVVNVTSSGRPYINAFWDGTKMVYGGGGDQYYSLASALDVVGHEMTHGVVEHTANLVYFGQSGAMNEGIADYFGNAIQGDAEGIDPADPEAGLLGETLCRTGTPRQCALRDLNDGRVAADDYVGSTGRIDSAGVHLNSTIFSGALWDIREKLGARADKVVLKALSEYMTPLDDFSDGRRAVLAAAVRSRLGARDLLTIARAFDAHGIRNGWERRIATDHDVLLRGVTDPYAQPDAAGDRYVVTNSSADQTAPAAVYTGRVRGGKAVQLSEPNEMSSYDAVTDGRSAVWTTYVQREDGWKMQLWSRPLDRSQPQRLIHEGDGDVPNMAVDGDTIAYSVWDSTTGGYDLWVKKGDAAPVNMTPQPGIFSRVPTISNGRIAYIKLYLWEGGPRRMVITTRDLATGQETDLPTPPSPPNVIGLVSGPVLTGTSLFWLQDAQQDGLQGIMRANADGGSPVALTPDDATAPKLLDMDATDTAITYSVYPDLTVISNDTLPKITQIPAKGGKAVRVTCNRGEQAQFASGEGGRVIWIDGTAAHVDLATRARPRGTCRAA
ncbi:M4 family metallopeptidase [Streptosporangium sp. NPDC001559]|uniref:M4 family metallopeptidase n=1 Tax=Streptosporangium sp. NPDC001559 TaxID=3366187 RepID=UPI0036E10508